MTSGADEQQAGQPIGQLELLRLIDANANRAGEGLRTLDDIARLVREDAATALAIKNLRHALADCLSAIPRSQRLACRLAATDAGTALTVGGESQRQDWEAVVSAACERVLQALRGLEEFGKVLSGDLGESFKHLRYAAYDVLARAELRLGQRLSLHTARLYLLIDCVKPLDDFVAYIKLLSASGVDVFQIRDKQTDACAVMQYARAAVATLADLPSSLIINDRADIAVACGASGVHVGQEDLRLEDVRRTVPSGMWIGVSTHSLEQALAAEAAGADYIGCGPTFASETKSFSKFAGTNFLSEVASKIQIPAFAIGGINRENLGQVLQAGVARVAVSHVIHSAADPAAAAKGLSEHLQANSLREPRS